MKILRRLLALSILSILGSIVVGVPHARANDPADLTVGMGYRDLGGTLRSLDNIDVTVSVVPRKPSAGPDYIPISYAPYNGKHLSPGGGNPTTNSLTFKTNQGTASHIFGGSYGFKKYNNVIWCGDSQGVPLGEFRLNVSLAASATEISYGGSTKKGHWIGYWHFQSGTRTDKDYGFAGNSVEIYAKNPTESFVYFEFVESTTASTSVNGFKVERKPDGSEPPAGEFTDAGVHLGAAVATSNPYFFYNVDPTKVNRMVGDDSDDWTQDGYSALYRALDGSVGGTTSGGRVYDIPVMYPGTTVETRWYYAPRPSTLSTAIYARDPRNGQIVNPCNSDLSQLRALCRTGSITMGRSGPGGALTSHLNADDTRTNYSTGGTAAPAGTTNSLTKNDLYYGNYTTTTTLPAGTKPYGTIVCGVNASDDSCAFSVAVTPSASPSVSVSVEPNRSYRTFIVLDINSGFTTPPTVTCDKLTGTLSLPDGIRADIVLSQGDQNIDVVTGLSSGAVNAAIPSAARDGLQRKIILVYRNSSGAESYRVDTGYSHQCPNNATCGANNLNVVFPNELGDSEGSVQVKLTMNNTGDSVWRNGTPPDGYASGEHALILTGESPRYWEVDAQNKPSSASLDNGEAIVKNGNNEFTVGLKVRSGVSLVNIPLTWQMAFISKSGAVQSFGEVCNASGKIITPTLRKYYRPWLRVQNGSLSALGSIDGQPAGSRGTRKDGDINYDATYVILSTLGGNNFCSSNAYLFGQGSNDPCVSSFSAYKTTLASEQASTYYDKVQSFIGSNPTCESATALSATRRTVVSSTVDNINTAMRVGGDYTAGGCDLMLRVNGGELRKPSGKSAWSVNKGKVSIIHSGNLTIKSDIVQAAPSAGADSLMELTNSFPAFGIIVNGDVTIDADVEQLDAMIFATGKIKTCSDYPTSTGTSDEDIAQKCSAKLMVRGGLYAVGGFQFGRNYFETSTGGNRRSEDFDYAYAEGLYRGGPAEDIIGNGVNQITMPPGFDLLPSGNASSLFYLQGNYTPRF